MKKLHFSKLINAPKEKVWHTMLDDQTYREWTAAFNPGSYYKGDWSKGSKILFLGPNPETGGESGMVSRIAEHKPYEFVSIEHLGIVQNGVEDTSSDFARKWAPAYENYSFKEKDGATEVQVDIDVDEEEAEMFNQMWPEALQKLKELTERSGGEMKPITVETTINAPMETVWEYWNEPEHITSWAFASDDWEAPSAENDLRVGSKFKTTMSAKDQSESFDFTGTYTTVQRNQLIEYDIDDGRHVKVEFKKVPEGVKVVETFDPENENSEEIQRGGWQAILDNFKQYVESNP